MSPHGLVIWLLAGATWAAILVPLTIRRRRRARAVLITDAWPPATPKPPRPVLGEYSGDAPASGAAWAVGPATDDDEGR